MALGRVDSAERDRSYAQLNADRFAAMKLDVRPAPHSRRLVTDVEIREAVLADSRLVATGSSMSSFSFAARHRSPVPPVAATSHYSRIEKFEVEWGEMRALEAAR